MGITELLTQYSIESIILLVVGIGLSFKVVAELWDWIYNRIKKHFNQKTAEDEDKGKIDLLLENQSKMQKSIEELSQRQERTTERLQENTRSFIIDKHHHFVYVIKAIDDINLQSLERRYMYYKADGGDSFIDQLMEEIRKLPRVNLQHHINEIERDGIM